MVDGSDYASKGDLAQLGGELSGAMQTLRAEVRGEMAELRGDMAELRGEMRELRGEMRELRADLRADIQGGHSELLKMQVNHERWVFGALLTQFALLIGLYGLILTRLH